MKAHSVVQLLLLAALLSACAAPAAAATQLPAATQTQAPPATATETPLPSPTPTPALLPLQIVEWNEFPYTNLADPSNTDTHVEVLIHNPNDVPVRIDQNAGELRFVNSAGETAYANPNPVFYIWQGDWMLPYETAALSACVCFDSSGLEAQEWETLELVMPLEPATGLAYTPDVEVIAGEVVDLAAAHIGGSGFGLAMTLTNTSDQVLESIAMRVQVYDETGRYLGTIGYGNAVVSFTEDVGIQPGDTGTGIEVIDIEYYDARRMTFEVHAIGILAQEAEPIDPPSDAPLTEWEGIPVMPGAINGQTAEGAYQFTTLASLEAITAYYEAELAKLGYQIEKVAEPTHTILYISSDSATGAVAIAPMGGLNAVVITLSAN
jgi:hypothetical protein